MTEQLPSAETEHPPSAEDAPPVVVARPLAGARHGPAWRLLELPGVRRRDAGLDLMVVLLASIVLPYLPPLLVPSSSGNTQLVASTGTLLVQKWCEASLVVGLLLYFVVRQGIAPASFGLRRDRIGRQLLWGLGTLGGVYLALLASSVVVLLLYLLLPGAEADLSKRVQFVEAMPLHNLPATLALLVAVAIHEEILFRGLLLPYLRRVLGSWWSAVLASTLIFALLHVPGQGLLAGAIQVLSIAVVLSVCFVLTRSLLSVVLAHLLFDFFQFQLLRLLPDLQKLADQVPS